MIRDVEHLQIDYARDHYCGHPVQGGIFNFGGGEIAVVYNRAPCRYQTHADVLHGPAGVHGRGRMTLTRSLDGGRSWPHRDDVAVFDATHPIETRRAFVRQVEEHCRKGTYLNHPPRQAINLADPNAAIFFGMTWIGEGDPPGLAGYSLRSADRGRTWESIPTPLIPPSDRGEARTNNHPIVQMPDGTHLIAAMHADSLWLYGSDDHGLTWDCLSQICTDPTGVGRVCYPSLILLPSGRLQCYSINLHGLNVLQMCHSDDGGYTWSRPRPIVRRGSSPWVKLRQPQDWCHGPDFGKHYRSPWPMRLADGRIVVLFARRKPPFGMGLIVSEDNGDTWSDEQIIRADASTPDIGYPVATEVSPGRIFMAYYYTLNDGNGFGGTRFIAGSFVSLENRR